MESKFKWILTLLLAFAVQVSFAQEKNISGKVLDNNKEALPGVNIVVKGTKRGAQTDFDGNYSIKANTGETLVFSYLGMKDKEVVVGASSSVNVTMETAEKQLSEVVVTAMGIKKVKDAVTSTVSIISKDELKTASNPDAIRSLAGKVSGLTINATSNGVTGTNSIRLRQMLSLTGSTEALVVIDNVISSADVLAQLSPDAIADVTVLKGAQGAALYGSQGKQGVVMVTTTKGSKRDKFNISFNSSVDMEQINFVPQRQTSYGQGWYANWDKFENGGWGPAFDGVVRAIGLASSAEDQVFAPYSSLGDDNIKDFYRQGFVYQNSLKLDVSNEKSYANFTLSNLKRDFILEGDNLNRNNFVINAGTEGEKFSLNTNLIYTNQHTKQANVNAETSRSDYTLLTTLLQTASNIPVEAFKNRGTYGWNGYYQNPWWAKDNNRLVDDLNSINLGVGLNYKYNTKLSFTHNGSIQFTNSKQKSYANEFITPEDYAGDIDVDYGSFNSPSEFYQSTYQRLYYYGDFIANYDTKLTESITFKANLGQNFQYSKSSRMSQGGIDLDIPGWYHIQNVKQPANPTSLSNSEFTTKVTATFLNTDFSYNDYLFLNLTGRYEGSSVVDTKNAFYFYPSAGLSFVPTKAIEGLKNNKWLSNAKVFLNYTQVGSLDPVIAHSTLNLAYLSTNFPYGDLGSYNDNYFPVDPNIKPERYTTYELGTNLSFLDGRFGLDIAVYQTDTDDLITSTSVSNSTGLIQLQANNGKLRAKGIDVDLSYKIFNTDSFKWNGRATFSHGETRVLDAGESTQNTIYDGSASAIDINIAANEGNVFPYINGTDWTRDANGNVIVYPGAVAGKGTPLASSKYVELGRTTPKYILGLVNNISYKGITLSATLDYRTGHKFVSHTKYNLTWNGHVYESGSFDRNQGFIIPGSVLADGTPNTTLVTGGNYTSTGAANLTQAYFNTASQVGSFNLIDATSFRIRELSLGYTLPKQFTERIGLENVKFAINARNPYVRLAKENRGYADPEAASIFDRSTSTAARNARGTMTNTNANAVGYIGDGQYPSTRTFGFTLSATF